MTMSLPAGLGVRVRSSASRRSRRAQAPRLENLETRALLSAGSWSHPVREPSLRLRALTAEQGDFDPSASPHARRPQRGIHRRDRRHPDSGALVARNISFPTTAGRSQSLDFYRPAGEPPPGGWPVVLAIHGGGWYRFSKDRYGARIAAEFTKRGFAVVAPNYLLARSGNATWPANLEDVQAAVRWIRGQSASMGLNASRIVAMGESAGGHLAELLGTGTSAVPGSAESDQVAAVVALSAPSDLSTLYRRSPAAGVRAVRFLGGRPNSLPSTYIAASPADQVRPGSAPMFLIHGSADDLVPVAQSVRMNAALAAAGVPHQLVVLPGGTHKLDFPGRYANIIPRILAFLDASWNHKG